MKRRKFLQTSLAASSLFSLKRASLVTGKSENGCEVINAGIGGNNSIDLLQRIENDCLAHRPDLTIVKVGTNDMNSKKFVPLDAYAKNLSTIIELILKANSKIVLMNLLPVYEPYLFTRHDPGFYQPEGHGGRLRQMNECIEKKALEYNVSFLDLHHLFSKAGNVGLDQSSWIKNEANSNKTDGLHPTPEGYRAIGLAVYQHIKYQKLKPSKIVCFGDSITFGDGGISGQSYPAWLNKLMN
jgi:lysophospholipase L1-like esterase